MHPQTLKNWVRRAEVDAGSGRGSPPMSGSGCALSSARTSLTPAPPSNQLEGGKIRRRSMSMMWGEDSYLTKRMPTP